ncbi:MAG: SDR family oxidoreductase [Chloroflexi bacterium]|nr:SDR family oxidoreductase [Chloroflexota bacterium]
MDRQDIRRINADGRLARKTALITGGGQGLGRAIAWELAREGASVAILEIDPASGEQAARELAGAGAQARSYTADVSRSADVDAAISAAIADLGSIDILVNNAGISRVGSPTHEVDDGLWDASIGVMQSGVFYASRAVARDLIAKQLPGSIIHISSIRGFTSNPGRIAYCAAKAAVIMMAQVMAAEWGRHGIRVNAIAPGVQRTPMWERDVQRGLFDEAEYLNLIPLGRLGDPREVGRLCVFLASDDAAYITGSSVTIDGGLTTIPSG